MGESHLESRIGHLLENANPTAAVYAKTAEVVIRITAKAASEEDVYKRQVPIAQLIEMSLARAGYQCEAVNDGCAAADK